MQEKLEKYLDTVKALINAGSENNIEKAIILLKKLGETEKISIETELILLNGRLQENEGDFRIRNLITSDDYKRELAQVKYALLVLIGDIPQKIEQQTKKAKEIKERLIISETNQRPLVFLIYDNNTIDRTFAHELKMHLMPLESITHEISIADIHEMPVGATVKTWREHKIATASLILCLVTPHFFVSQDKLFNLTQTADENGRIVVPILVKPTPYFDKSFLFSLTPLPANKEFISNWADRDFAYTEIVEAVQSYIQGL